MRAATVVLVAVLALGGCCTAPKTSTAAPGPASTAAAGVAGSLDPQLQQLQRLQQEVQQQIEQLMPLLQLYGDGCAIPVC